MLYVGRLVDPSSEVEVMVEARRMQCGHAAGLTSRRGPWLRGWRGLGRTRVEVASLGRLNTH